MSIRRYTQVRLKGSVLKTDRGVKPRGGSNPSTSLFTFTTHKCGIVKNPLRYVTDFFIILKMLHRYSTHIGIICCKKNAYISSDARLRLIFQRSADFIERLLFSNRETKTQFKILCKE